MGSWMRVKDGVEGGERVGKNDVEAGTGGKISECSVESIQLSSENRGMIRETGHDGDVAARYARTSTAVPSRPITVYGRPVAIGGQQIEKKSAPGERR